MQTPARVDESAYSEANIAERDTSTANSEEKDVGKDSAGAVHYNTSTSRKSQVKNM